MSYQGNKNNYSTIICNIIRSYGGHEDHDLDFWDICCGSGQVSSYWPRPSNMVDIGPWGRFWSALAARPLTIDGIIGTLKGKTHAQILQLMHMAKLQPVPESDYLFALHFIVLQTFAFNGKPVETHGSTWKHPGFPPNPSLKTLYAELTRIKNTTVAQAIHGNGNEVFVSRRSKIYIDPDYKGTQGYGHTDCPRRGRINHTFDVAAFVARHPHCHVFVSHHEPIELPNVNWTEIKDITIPGLRRKKQSTELLHIMRATNDSSSVESPRVPEPVVSQGV